MDNLFLGGISNTDIPSYRTQVYKNHLDNFVNLSFNAIRFTNYNYDIPQDWVKYLIFCEGKFCIYNDMILSYRGTGSFNLYGKNTQYTAIGYNGVTFNGIKPENIARIETSYTCKPFLDFLKQGARIVADCDIAINQNLKRIQRGKLLLTANDKTAITIKKALSDLEDGYTQVIGQEGIFNDLKNYDFNEMYFADKIYQLKQQYISEIYERIGVTNANNTKKERIQSMEVASNIGTAYDNVKIIVDVTNHNLELNKIDFRVELNGAINDLYLKEIASEGDENAI
jgi:hypothetical protein